MKLKFRKSHARVLKNTAQRLRRGSAAHRKLAPIFELAAAAAKTGEICELDEPNSSAEQIADGFARFGAPRPEIVE